MVEIEEAALAGIVMREVGLLIPEQIEISYFDWTL